MISLNVVDIIIILLILLSGIVGFKRGVLKEVVMLVGTIIIYVIAFSLKNPLGLILCKIFPFFNLDGLISLNILIYQLIAFIFIAGFLFSIYSIILKLTGILQKLVDLTIILTLPSKFLGLVFGLIEGYIVMFIILVTLSIPFRDVDMFVNSSVSNTIINKSPILTKTMGGVGDAIFDIYDLTEKVSNKSDENLNEINLDIVKVELDYKIISKEDLLEIIDMKKLDDIPNIEDYVKNY